MKVQLYIILFLTLIVSSDLIAQQTTMKILVGKAYVGMTIEELKSEYKSAHFVEEPVYEYGIEGTSMGMTIVQNEERLFFVWTMEESNIIHGITIITPTIKIDGNVKVGMTLSEFFKKYPNNKLAIDMSDNDIEFSYVQDMKYRIEFLTTESTRIGEYDFKVGEPEFKRVVLPNSKIDRISIK